MDIGLAVGRIFANDEDGLHLTPFHRFEHEREVDARFRVQVNAVDSFELAPSHIVVDVLETRQFVRKRTHVAAALHVVLATQRHQAATPSSDMAGQECQVAQRQHIVDGVVMFGNSERP